MQNGRHFKQLSHIELAPPQKIPAMLDTKRMCLALSAPPLLLLSSIAPPAQRCRCSCPKPLQPSRSHAALPFEVPRGQTSGPKFSSSGGLWTPPTKTIQNMRYYPKYEIWTLEKELWDYPFNRSFSRNPDNNRSPGNSWNKPRWMLWFSLWIEWHWTVFTNLTMLNIGLSL